MDGPPSSHAQAVARAKVKRRDRSASNSLAATKQRPKSMFVKAATPEPGRLKDKLMTYPVSMGYFWPARLLVLSYDPSS